MYICECDVNLGLQYEYKAKRQLPRMCTYIGTHNLIAKCNYNTCISITDTNSGQNGNFKFTMKPWKLLIPIRMNIYMQGGLIIWVFKYLLNINIEKSDVANT